MIGPARLLRRLGSLLQNRRRDKELDEELQFHIDMEATRLQNDGHPRAEALHMARQRFGNPLQVRESSRDSRGVRVVEDFLQDLRFGVRSLGRQRVHATVATLTLAIGIGATTAIFGAVYGVLLAPLPYSDSERIVTLWQTSTTDPTVRDEVAPGNFLDWQERQRAFSAIAAAEPYSLDYVGPEGPERFQNAVVTESFFEILDAPPLLGRTFARDEFQPGRNNVVILSEEVWRTRFGADTSLIGRTLLLDSMPLTVIGVMPLGVDLPNGEEMWTPKVFRPDERTARTSAYYTAIGRLAPGVGIDAAQADLQRVARELAVAYPATNATISATIVSLGDALFGEARRSLWLLLGAVGFVLLIACANVASLQLAQAVRRQRELSIRAALGAGRGRLARQLLAESLLLSFIGGAAGIAVAFWGVSAIRALGPANLPRLEQVGLSGTMLLFAAITSVAAALFFGTLPMLQARRVRLAEVIGSSGGGGATQARVRRRMQRLLVGSEVALALALLVGAGLLVRSFASLLQVDRGFSSTGIVNVTLQAWNYYPTSAHRVAYVREAAERIAALPGVEAAGMTSSLPLSVPIGMDRTSMLIEGQPDLDVQQRPVIHVAAISPSYPSVLRIPFLAGRAFEDSDNASGAPVAIVNAAFARRYWPEQDPIGKQVTFRFQGAPVARTIVGIIGDVRHGGLESDAPPSVFVPHAQAPTGAVQLVARATGDVAAAQRAIRAELAAMNGAMPLSEITSLDARLSDSLRERRFHLGLLAAFSITAVLLAAIGIYGMMNQLTSERTREIGVRVALGARAGDVVWMVLRQGVSVAVAGLMVGLFLAFVSTRLMTGMLYQVQPLDPLTYIGALVVVLVIAACASLIPARRAATVNPVTVLRND